MHRCSVARFRVVKITGGFAADHQDAQPFRRKGSNLSSMTLERSSADTLPPITPPVGVLVIVEQISRDETEHIPGFFTVMPASVPSSRARSFTLGKKILRSALRWAVS